MKAPMALLGNLLLTSALLSAQSTEKGVKKPAIKPKPVLVIVPTDPVELLRSANMAFERKEWVLAIELYDRLLQVDPGNPAGVRRRTEASAYLATQMKAEQEAGQIVSAQKAEAGRLATERKKLPLYVETARTLIRDQSWKDAESYLVKIEAVEPDHPLLLQPETLNARIEMRRDGLREAMKTPGNKVALGEALVLLQALSPKDPLIVEVKAKINQHVGTYAGQTWTDPTSGITFCWIPPGSFDMGLSSGGSSDEKPSHRVTLTQGFWMGRTEVTQTQWQANMGNNPSLYSGDDKPVQMVSWNDCQKFLKRLNSEERSLRFRLPTEAEWEYACRAGSVGFRYGDLDAIAWYSNNCVEPRIVGQKQANDWGLHDMLGNVWEWCEDWFEVYSANPAFNPSGPTHGTRRVNRGGSWNHQANKCRATYRDSNAPDDRDISMGLRVVAVARTP